MHICMVSRISPKHSIGGMELNSFRLSKELVKRGHEVTYLTTGLPGSENTLIEENISGVRVVYIEGGPPGKYSRAWGDRSVAFLEDLHKERKIHIVHGHSSSPYYIYKSSFLERYRIPLVTTYHGTHLDWLLTSVYTDLLSWNPKGLLNFVRDSINHLYRLIGRDIWLARGSDAITAIDNEAVNKIKWQYFVPKRKIHLIYNSVDPEKYFPQKSNYAFLTHQIVKDRIILLSAARLEKSKGIQYSIIAASKLKKDFPHLHLLVLGDGPYRSQLEKLVKSLGMDDSVTFAGFVSPDKMNEYYNSCKIFLNPTIRINGYTTTLVEAMATEKVVIASKLGGTKTLINHNEDGFLIQRRDVDDMVRIVSRLLKDSELSNRIGKNARKKVCTTFNILQMTENIIALYNALVK